MFNPISTYRIQFHKGFTFQHFKAALPYLRQLGINTIYASPIFSALPGSMHGYDVTDPLAINPEIGTLEELREISKTLKESGIGWVQDIVPNHMAYHPNNLWLMDVLSKGEASEFAPYFDILWSAPGNEKLMVPFLGKPLEEVIGNGELTVVKKGDTPFFAYFDEHYPLSAPSAETFLADGINLSADKLLQLAAAQHYRLCHWQETDSQINYRRFFTVNSLICLNIQNEAVFHHHHSFIKQLVDDGIFQGLRVDHVDGLYNPTEYLVRLRRLCGDDTYIVVEKILEPGEQLPANWPVQGSSGYDFLGRVNNLFTARKAEGAFTDFYHQLTGNYTAVGQQIQEKKAYILSAHMGGELHNLYRYFLNLHLVDKRALSRIPSDDLSSAIGGFLVQCPVYRFYSTSFPLQGTDEAALKKMLARLHRSGESAEATALLESVFISRPHEGDADLNHRIAQFFQRCMQFTGPLMAKGVEDTLMYTYNAFIGHNEVGDAPDAFGGSISGFHAAMRERQLQWPMAMNGTATHDTKRGEDARCRLNVLTALGDSWIAEVQVWMELNAPLKKAGMPDANDEYLLYQTLVAHYPPAGEDDFTNRLQAFVEKALREAKTRSGWAEPAIEYEQATKDFAVALLDKEAPFWQRFQAFFERLQSHAAINSLSQVLLKFTLPGMPDVYQGTELWDYSFVDPDNRRAVDYALRNSLLKDFDETPENLLPRLWKMPNGAIKLWLTRQLLAMRKSDSGLFAEGDYIPLQTEGVYKEHVFAFARKQGDKTYLFAVPLHTALLTNNNGNFFKIDWQDTRIIIPTEFNGFSDVLSGATIARAEGLLAKNLFRRFTVALLKGRQADKVRGAGILAHITSLPSAFGVGDLGPAAKTFVDFLHRGGQKYWQLLPLNPTDDGQGWSPYSAQSSKAGWPLLLSPELLVRDGWLKSDPVAGAQWAASGSVDYASAEGAKAALLKAAYEAFTTAPTSAPQQEFQLFCEKEKSWLADFALFVFLKNVHNGRPWYQWATELKSRDEETLDRITEDHEEELKKIKWLQYIFITQWKGLKTYANNRNIKLVGDMPFYVSYDSADVWADQQLFSVDENGDRTGMAGVPPDAFSADGQLWGMPTFNWEKLKEDGYRWWINRLRKNMELFDLTRLDHFRAFEAYWEVPAGEETAKNGTWKQGPGSDLFRTLQKEFGSLPFVAEDLGDINDAVLSLRDEAALPGMKVLQFAFGDDLPQSGYIPHNYTPNFIVYTGTHDNNTTVGWWRTETGEALRQRVKAYVGQDVHEGNVHTTFARLAYASVANIAILPVQDVLGLNETARMNVPSTAANNWSWRLLPGQLHSGVEKVLAEWVALYNR